MYSTMLSTRRIGARGACRLVDMGPANSASSSASMTSRPKCSAGTLTTLRIPAAAATATATAVAAHPQHHARQQVRTNYSSLIDPGSAASSGAGGGSGSRAPWQAEENIDIQKVTQTAIVSFFAAYAYVCSLEHMQRGCAALCQAIFYCLLGQPSRFIDSCCLYMPSS